MAIGHDHQLIHQLRELLGLPAHTRKFVLTAEINEAVTVEAEYFPDPPGNGLVTVTKKFRLEEIDEPAEHPE